MRSRSREYAARGAEATAPPPAAASKPVATLCSRDSFTGAVSRVRCGLPVRSAHSARFTAAVAIYSVLALGGCGGSSGGRSSSAGALAHALVSSSGGQPRPTFASCRSATGTERRLAPFGPTRTPEFSCLIAVNGERAPYAVQLLPNGCYVAERKRPGQAVYGCEALKRSSSLPALLDRPLHFPVLRPGSPIW